MSEAAPVARVGPPTSPSGIPLGQRGRRGCAAPGLRRGYFGPEEGRHGEIVLRSALLAMAQRSCLTATATPAAGGANA